jgi:dolichol kinase
MKKKIEKEYKQEIIRKGIHLCSLSIPICYSFWEKSTILWILLPITFLFFAVDMSIKVIKPLRELVQNIFGPIMRPHELKNEIVLNGATWVFISACICILILPKLMVVCGFSILIISDTAAALLGKKYGKHKWFVNKSIEGTASFAGTAIIDIVIIGLLISADWQYYVVGIAAAIIGSLVEAVSGVLKIDDNFSIPLSIGFMMWGGSYLSVILTNYNIIDLLK